MSKYFPEAECLNTKFELKRKPVMEQLLFGDFLLLGIKEKIDMFG
jgi:hypothetical protein